MKWFRRGFVMFVVVAAAIVIGLALRPRPIETDTMVVTRGPLRATVDELARARVKDRYVVTAPIAGTLARPELLAGARVTANQPILRITPTPPPLLDARTRNELGSRVDIARATRAQALATVERAKVAEADAERELAEMQRLLNTGAITRHDVDKATADRDARRKERESAEFAAAAAKHQVTLAEGLLARASSRSLEELVVTSPVDGRVLRVMTQSEGTVTPGQQLMEIGDPRALEIVAELLTADAVQVTAGDPVTFDGWGGAPLHGHVRLVEPSAFTKVSALGVEEQRVNVVMDPDGPAEAWAPVGDGWRLEAHIEVWAGTNVVIAPSSALFRHGTDWAVFVAQGGHARLRTVEIGHRAGGSTEIRRGLAPADVVVMHPSDRLRDGVAIEAR